MYKALYRKYRPQTFDQVWGQEHITTVLKNQILHGSIGHAYLFSGTRGTGKTSTAKIFARAVNCLNLVDGNPCNECEICKGIMDETIMDVIEMDAASNNSVEDVRELREKVKYPPSNCKYKVYIIDEVHMLSKGAFNALLKTLEEPPEHLIFILATTEVEKLPQTILSRCQRFDFKRITVNDIISNMKKICSDMNVAVDESVLHLIARNCDGAMRDALSLLEQCISFEEGHISMEDALEILGITNYDLIFQLIDNIKYKELDKALNLINEIIQDGKDINQFIKDLIYHFRNLMIIKTSVHPSTIIEMEPEIIEMYKKQAQDMSLSFVLEALNIFNDSENKAKWSTQPRIILEMAVIRLIKMEGEKDIYERVRDLEDIIANGSIPVNHKPKEEKKEKPHKTEKIKINAQDKPADKVDKTEKSQRDDGNELNIDIIKERWDNALKFIKEKKIVIHALLIEGSPISYENGILSIEYKQGYGIHREAISKDDNKNFVEKILSEYFNKEIKVRFVMEGENLLEINKEEKEDILKPIIDFFGKDLIEVEKKNKEEE